MSQWVQHKSDPGGKKFRVLHEHMFVWQISISTMLEEGCSVPKSEYILCDPPEEEWEDVTGSCRIGDSVEMPSTGRQSILFGLQDGCTWSDVFHPYQSKEFRIRKIDGTHNGPCFIVERRKP